MGIFFFCLLLIVIAVVVWQSLTEEKKIARRFAGRPDLSAAEFFARYYAGTQLKCERVEDILGFVGDGLTLPTAKLLPTDRFDKEMAPIIELDSGLGMVMEKLQICAKNHGRTIDLREIQTLDDYIRAAEPLWE